MTPLLVSELIFASDAPPKMGQTFIFYFQPCNKIFPFQRHCYLSSVTHKIHVGRIIDNNKQAKCAPEWPEHRTYERAVGLQFPYRKGDASFDHMSPGIRRRRRRKSKPAQRKHVESGEILFRLF